MKTLLRISDITDEWLRRVSLLFGWASIPLIFVIVFQVILRYVFQSGLIQLEELQWHLYGLVVIFGMVYAQASDSQVRVDLLHTNFPKKAKAWIEFVGTIVLILPFLLIVLNASLDFTYDSFRTGETSDAPGGLPFRWLIKSLIPVGMFLLLLGNLSRFLRELTNLVNPNGSK